MIDLEEQKQPKDSSIVIIAMVIALLVFSLSSLFGRGDLALSVCICLGAVLLVIRTRWDLRKCFWFWATIFLVLLLHVPVVLMVPFPHITVNRITLLPIGVADFLIVLGAVRFVEKFIVKYVPPDEGA